MLSTVGVLVVIFVLAYFFKKSRFVQRAVGTMQVESQIALGQKERLMKIKVDDRRLLLGVTANSINLILDLDAVSSTESSARGTVSDELTDNALLTSNGKANADASADQGEKASAASASSRKAAATSATSNFSSAYKSAKAAYDLKQYETVLTHLTQVAASAAAAAAIEALRNDQKLGSAQSAIGSLGQAGSVSQVGSSSQLSSVSQGSGGAASSLASSDLQDSLGATGSGLQGVETQGAVGATPALGPELAATESNVDPRKSTSEEVSEHTTVSGEFPQMKAKAIVEPHANEAHNIANHFSSEHTIVRASKSTQFMNSQFTTPPDREVLHARAKRAKYNTRALELEVEPQPKDPYRPRSEKLLNSDLDKHGAHKSHASHSKAGFDQALGEAMQNLKPGTARHNPLRDEPWVAEDDLAAEFDEIHKR